MALSCNYKPHNKQGEELKGFSVYRKELGYPLASKVFTQVLSPSFQKDFKSKLVLDEQGVPTYESAITTSHIKKFIGTSKLIQSDQKKYPSVEDTRENYHRLVSFAHAYNTTSDNRDALVAVVAPAEKGKIRVEIREKSNRNLEEYKNQYSTLLLNEKIVDILGRLGITIEMLEKNEITNGYVDFSKAASIADGFAGLINIANGMEGELSLSEEFSHLLIEMFRGTPLVQRSLNILTNNEDLVKEILGEEYQRNYEYYSTNPNYDSTGNRISIQETLAEEALGRVLQDKLINNVDKEEYSKPLNTLIQRLLSYIKSIFKGMDSSAIIKAKNDVNTTMEELAKNVLSGTKKITTDELIKNKRNARFNHLKDGVDKVIQLLQNADEIERKRSKLSPKTDVPTIKKRILQLESLMTDANKLEGLHTYAKWALADLQSAMNKLDISGTLETGDFTTLRHIKSVLDSYYEFINDFHEVLDEMGDETTIVISGEEVDLRELWRGINDIYKTCMDAFKKQAYAAFSDFLAPIYEKSPLRNPDGSIKTLDEVLVAEDFDISEFDRWLTSMGNSSSVLLQLFDKAVKNAKDKVRIKTITNIREIWKIRDDAEKMGITSFEWIYERTEDGHLTGNYLSEFNLGQFEKDRKAFEESLKEKYGENPKGEEYKKYFNERKAWYEQNTVRDMFGIPVPNSKYRNAAYDKLSENQKKVLKDILFYKSDIEKLLPADRRNRNRAIQKRRNNVQRLINTASNPMQAYESIKEELKSAFSDREDDDIMYGESTKGLTDFTGQEYLTLPVLYTGRLRNPDALSTDIFSDLMAYAYMANNYDAMSKIYDPLEIGVGVVKDKDFIKKSDSKVKEEVINVLGRVSRKPVKMDDNTSFAKKLRDYLECQVYGRYLKEDDIVGKNKQKFVSLCQRASSLAYLGCNYLAGVANVATAAGMQNIEAASGEFFGAKELLAADKEYAEMIPEFVAELPNRKKQSELALFDELFNVKQNFKDRVHNIEKKSILQRFFGTNWLFIQQGLGDHWIYNRTALAMAKKRKVKVGDKIMSVWDAREVVTDKNGYKYMKIKDGAMNIDKNGNVTDEFSATDFAREIAHINHTIAGIYNDEDQNAANRVMIGRLGQQMRKWIVPQMMRRFQSKRMILDIGKEEEGYYRTAWRFITDLRHSGFKITEEWDNLTDSEKANCRRALTEILQTTSLWIITLALGSRIKDPDRSWGMKFAEYMANRELHELGFLTPSPLMFTEGYKTITSPFVVLSATDKAAKAILATMNPYNWFPDDDELIQSGRYEGHSHLYKRWAELPLPPMTQIRQLEKFFDELDTGIRYYSRDYK